MILVRFLDFEGPTQTRGYNDRNFKSTALERFTAKMPWSRTLILDRVGKGSRETHRKRRRI
jgi:hypothetical protein